MLRKLLRHPQAPAQPQHALEIAENLSSLAVISPRELPEGPARDALVALAASGHEVYAYRPLGADYHNIWIRPAYPHLDGRMTCAEYLRRFNADEHIDVGDELDASREGC